MDDPRDAAGLQKFSRIRNITAEKLVKSWETIPHFFPKIDFSFGRIELLRNQWNERWPARELSYECLFLWAIRECLPKTPILNSHCFQREISVTGGDKKPSYFYEHHTEMHVAVSVNAEISPGEFVLVTPVCRNLESKMFHAVVEELSLLVEQARRLKLPPSAYEGATIMLNNFGALGYLDGTPIVVWPQSTNIGFGKATVRPVVEHGENGPRVVPWKMCTITLGCDHRAYDAIPPGRFLENMKAYLENFPESVLFPIPE